MSVPTAIVTGAGSGIGRASALALADRGTNVLALGRRAEPLMQLEQSHDHIMGMVADVTVEADIRQAVKAAVSTWDKVDVVVNNAGSYAPGSLGDISVEQIERLSRTYIVAPTLLVREALAYLRVDGGAVVNVSSLYAAKAAAGSSHYAATKAALESLTRSWALELAPLGIRVNAVSPGPTETDLLVNAGLSGDRIAAIKEREAAAIPLGRRGSAEEVAMWVVAFADTEVSWVTGQVLAVDGGLGLK